MKEVPIPTLHLFEPLEQKLIGLLQSLAPEDWNKPTAAKLWSVKDVTAHLLDTSIRTLAQANNYAGDPPDKIDSYQDLVTYLNRLNADWVKAMKRVSPQTLIDLLRLTQNPAIDYFRSLDPWAPAQFAVSWAGESESANWFHIAREYTERWHHQQQIRDAVNQDGIMDREFYYPMIDTLMRALPHTYRFTKAPKGNTVSVLIEGPTGGLWSIESQGQGWKFVQGVERATVIIKLDADTAWKLFTKALNRETAHVSITGDKNLGLPIFNLVAVMA